MNNIRIVSNNRRNPKSFWCYIHSHMKTRSSIDSIQYPDSSTAVSDQEQAVILNLYFASVFTDKNLAGFSLIVRSLGTQVSIYIYIITALVVSDELNKLKHTNL